MQIVKEFEVESAHIVRNCTSDRCSHSVHGHSAKIEICLESNVLDNAQMVYDFGLMKNTIKQFVDSMDHCYLLCDKDEQQFQEFIKSSCKRYIILPFNPSAEMLSMFIFAGVKNILEHTHKMNGEDYIVVKWVKYHETRTGYAQCDGLDVSRLYNEKYSSKFEDIVFSDGIREDWGEDLKYIIDYNGEVCNPDVKQQIIL